MMGQRQGVQSIKPHVVLETKETEENGGVSNNKQKKHGIVITVNEMRRYLFNERTGKLPQTLSQGNKYQVLLQKINSNSTCVEPMKNHTKD